VTTVRIAFVLVILGVLAGAGLFWFTRTQLAVSARLPIPAAAPEPAPEPEVPSKDATPLPEVPKADPKSELNALLPDKTLYLETKPDKTKRILFVAEVCLREGQLEVLVCKKNTKEHEAIVRTEVDARLIHAALIAAGGKPGSPVRFVNKETGEPDYKPATGGKVAVSVVYNKGGKLFSHPAQDWIKDLKTKKPMAHEWVFAGSRFLKNPDKPTDPEYYTANNGEVISISNFVDSMLEVPVEVSRDNADLSFDAMTEKIPPLLSKVWVILEPVGAK